MAAGLILSTNPQTLTAPVAFTGTAVYGPAGTAWVVTNQTSIAGNGPDTPPSKGIGIELASGGTVTNQVGASFVGFDYGVKILAAAGTVANSAPLPARKTMAST